LNPSHPSTFALLITDNQTQQTRIRWQRQEHKIMADIDIDRLLEVEASAIQKDAEVERIMACFKLDPYDILELDVGCTEKDIKMTYRRKS
jgi:hypothetical protein